MSDELPKFSGAVQNILDISSIGAYQTCPRKYQLSVLEGWRYAHSLDSSPRDWGHAVHAALEAYDRVLFAGGDEDAAVDAALIKGAEYETVLSSSADNARTYATLNRAVVWYSETYRGDDYRTAAQPDGSPCIEVRFEIPFIAEDTRLSGRIDRLVERNGELYIWDRKTTATALGSYYFRNYKLDNQKIAYIYALRNVMGMPVQGFVVDAIQALVGSNRFARQTFDVTDEQIEEWLSEMREVANTMNHHARYLNERNPSYSYPRNFQGCRAYGGCQFFDVCSSPPSIRQAWLETDFSKKDRLDDNATTHPVGGVRSNGGTDPDCIPAP